MQTDAHARAAWSPARLPAPFFRALAVGLCLLGVLVAGVAQAAPIRIMPLGDSITVGIGDTTNGGYRGPLYQALTAAGHSVDFVGSQVGGAITDPHHEGHSGWRADEIRNNISAWLGAAAPDIVLLHIGTNDITQGEHAPAITTEIAQILVAVGNYESANHRTIPVIVARIINRSNPLDALGIETTALNASIASMTADRIAAGDHLVVVDHESALSYPADLADVVHPNAGGYGKMATVWSNALSAVFHNKGDFVDETIRPVMVPGVSYNCSITMLNSGYQAWLCSPTGTMLTVGQTTGPVANKLIPYPYFQIYTDPCRIDIGQSCVFPFTIDVPPDTPFGQYEIAWQMKDNDEWFDSDSHNAVFRKTVEVRAHPYYKGDFDDDGDVDQTDFGRLQSCLGQHTNPACAGAFLTDDGLIDALDVVEFKACLSGVEAAPPPDCEK